MLFIEIVQQYNSLIQNEKIEKANKNKAIIEKGIIF